MADASGGRGRSVQSLQHQGDARRRCCSTAKSRRTLGIEQSGKWDCSKIPWQPSWTSAQVCDNFRALVWGCCNADSRIACERFSPTIDRAVNFLTAAPIADEGADVVGKRERWPVVRPFMSTFSVDGVLYAGALACMGSI